MRVRGQDDGPLVTAGAVLGIGLGGFVDGIVFHQLLQWHAMVSAIRPPFTLLEKQINTFWDGVFHACTWLATVVGVGLLWRATGRADVPRSGTSLVGAVLLGCAAFNLVEGVIDHHLLGLHNVKEVSAHTTAWNVGFLLASLAIGAGGWLLVRQGRAGYAGTAERHPGLAPAV